jgi:transcriptional regulator with XRE-family HTH domain
MHMGDKKITRAKLAIASGIKRPTLSNKLDNMSEFTLDEIVQIAHALGKSWLWVLTGVEEGGDGGHPLKGVEPPAPLLGGPIRQSAKPTDYEDAA